MIEKTVNPDLSVVFFSMICLFVGFWIGAAVHQQSTLSEAFVISNPNGTYSVVMDGRLSKTGKTKEEALGSALLSYKIEGLNIAIESDHAN